MKTGRTDNRVSAGPYRLSLEGVQTQFEIIRLGLKHMPKKRMAEYLKSRAEQERKTWAAFVAKFKQGLSPEMIAKMEAAGMTEDVLVGMGNQGLRKKYRLKDSRVRLELSEDRINQSELLLLVAYFESFMKVVHRAFLNAAPARVFRNSNADIPVRDVFDPGVDRLSTVSFLKGLVNKEVKALDREGIERKAEYFAKHFQITFGTKAELDELREIMETRNKISHEIYAPPPKRVEDVSDQALVPDNMLNRARNLFIRIPTECVKNGAKRYPLIFNEF